MSIESIYLERQIDEDRLIKIDMEDTLGNVDNLKPNAPPLVVPPFKKLPIVKTN